jgi:hypothetical protein
LPVPVSAVRSTLALVFSRAKLFPAGLLERL